MNMVVYRILFIYFSVVFMSWANPGHRGKYKQNKTIKKTFVTDTQTNVNLDNIYGNINISTWHENKVEITVKIEVIGDDLDNIKSKMKDISIHFSSTKTDIYASTDIASNNYSSGWSFWSFFTGKTNNLGFKIDYFVKMPIESNLFIKSDYGNIYIDNLDGNLNLDADYGKFDFGELNGNDNIIKIDYFSSSNIDFVKNAKINADYSSISIGNAYILDINSDYTKINIDKVRMLYFDNDYGSIVVNDVKKVKGRGDYQTRYFKNIYSLDFSGDYGSVKVVNPVLGFDKIVLNCDYTNIKIINERQSPYKFNLQQDYGCFKNDNLQIVKQIEDNSDRKIEGYFKDQKANSIISINTDYGCVKLINN